MSMINVWLGSALVESKPLAAT